MSRVKETKEQKMTEEQGALVTTDKFQKHIDKIAEHYAKRTCDFKFYKKEFFAIAWAAACEVAMRYDPTKGYEFTTFSTMYIKGMIGHYIIKYVKSSFVDKQDRMYAKMFSIDTMVNDDDEEQSGEEIISSADIDEQERHEQLLDRIDALLCGLTTDERRLVEMRFRFDGDKDAFYNWAESQGISGRHAYRKAEEVIAKIALKTIK